MENSTLKSIDSKVENYPYPIAQVFDRYLSKQEEEFESKHDILCDLFEVIVKISAIILIQGAYTHKYNLNDAFGGGLSFLKRPSLGQWLMIIRELTKIEKGHYWQRRIRQWYLEGNVHNEIREAYKALPEVKLEKGVSPVVGICDTLVTYRNKVWKGHGAKLPESSFKDRVNSLELLLTYILDAASFFEDMQVMYVQEQKVLDKNRYEASCISLSGTKKRGATIDISSQVENGEIYLSESPESQETSTLIKLTPLVQWLARAGEEGTKDFYIYNHAQKTKIEYLCYTDGSYYYHKDIKPEIASMIEGYVMEPVDSEDYETILYKYTEEERVERSRVYYNHGNEFANKGQWEAALKFYEDALMYYKTPEIVLQQCRALRAIGEEIEYVQSVLSECLEMKPEYPEALQFQEELIKGKTEDVRMAEEEASPQNSPYTYYDFAFYKTKMVVKAILQKTLKTTERELQGLCDKIPDQSSPLVWGVAVTLLYVSTSAALFFYDTSAALNYLPVALMFLLQALTMLVGLTVGKQKFVSGYYSLLAQMDNVKQEKADEWIQNQSKLLFGYFLKEPGKRKETNLNGESRDDDPLFPADNEIRGSKGSIRLDIEKEKWFLFPYLAFVVVWSLSMIITQKLYACPLPLAMVQFFHSSIIWVLIGPFVRFIILSTLFIRQYSCRFPLNPVVSKSGNSGFHTLISFHMTNLAIFVLFWITLWGWNLMLTVDPFYLDMVGLTLGAIVAMFFTVLAPIFIMQAIRLSKEITSMSYKDHINFAFKEFVRSPTEESREKLDWLLDNEERINRISTRVLSFKYKVMIILSNLLILAVSALYILVRLGHGDLLVGTLGNVNGLIF